MGRTRPRSSRLPDIQMGIPTPGKLTLRRALGKGICVAIVSASILSPAKAQRLYSNHATPASDIATMLHGLPSPDGRSVIHAREIASSSDDSWPFKIWVTAGGRNYPLAFGTYVGTEVGWSPDSTAFFVTYSDGGAVGQFHALIYEIDSNGVHRSEPVPNGSKLSKPHCSPPQEPNVGAIKWGVGSQSLFIAVEVPPHSSCASMGTFRVFEITRREAKVLGEYDQLEAKKLLAESLGAELRNADDDCIKKPKTCVLPGVSPPSSHRAPR